MRPLIDLAYDSIRAGAPGLSDATCKVIAASIARKAQAAPADPVAGVGEAGIATKLIERLESWPISFSSGVCMCGAEMEGHTVYDNHAPTDSGEYNVHEMLKEAKVALAALSPSPDAGIVAKLVGALEELLEHDAIDEGCMHTSAHNHARADARQALASASQSGGV